MGKAWYIRGDQAGSFFSGDSVDYNDTPLEFGGPDNWMPELATGATAMLNGAMGGASSYASGSDSILFDLRWSFLGDISK